MRRRCYLGLIVTVAAITFVWLLWPKSLTTRGADRVHAGPNHHEEVKQLGLDRANDGRAKSSELAPSLAGGANVPRATTTDLAGGVHRRVDYTLTIRSPTSVAVNLAGGESQVSRWDERALVLDRPIRGRVRDESGRPVAGAIVLADKYLRTTFGSLVGIRGATTSASGDFAFTVPSGSLYLVVALHRDGWSAPHAIAAGTDPVSLELVLLRSARLFGRVTRAGKPEAASVELERIGEAKLVLSLETRPNGVFEFALVPPGDYVLRAGLAQGFTGGKSTTVEKTVVLAPGDVVAQDIELPTGALLVVKIPTDVQESASSIEYVLLPGDVKIDTREELQTFMKGGGVTVRGLSFSGTHVRELMQFYDLAPSPYLVCVTVWSRRREQKFACARTTVQGEDVVEVEVPIH